MKRIVRFSKLRFIALTVSLALIAFGVANFFIGQGFNLGIDFKGGLIQQIQVAPVALTFSNSGESALELEIVKGGILESDKKYLNIMDADGNKNSIELTGMDSLNQLIEKVQEISALQVTVDGPATVSPERLISIKKSIPAKETATVNYSLQSGDKVFATLTDVRNLLGSIEGVNLQVVGEPEQQEYIIRANVPETDSNEAEAGESNTDVYELLGKKIIELFQEKYGTEQVLIKQSETMGAQLAQVLAMNSVYYILIALVLILIYITIRFKITYAVGAIVALVHDVLIMLGFICVLKIEISTATIAAVLTIIGYSLNDTIVVYDRIRENFSLLKDHTLDDIIDTSITQSLSRTIVTSLTTLIAVIPLYILITGTSNIKDFALSLIVGIVVGTYSSIFIASPVVLGWQRVIDRKKEKRDLSIFGKRPSSAGAVAAKPETKIEDKTDKTTVNIDQGEPASSTEHRQITRVQRTVQKKKKKKKKKR
ncbi:MAG: protein translocase subunit SecF [Spirochaetales bacterium]|nr:protein translocase subunit SecF [Spirochaetales bacterium]